MLNIRQIFCKLQEFWHLNGCIILQPYDMEIGAGTSHTATFLKSLEFKIWKAAYIQYSRRPKDSKFGKNIFKLQQYYQFQVILKPCPNNIIDLYLNSLIILGINFKTNDLRFIEDNWKNPTLGAWGIGWEILLNGIEISQFTYFQQIGGIYCDYILIEITYGIERIAINLQNINNIFNIIWDKCKKKKNIFYKNIFKHNEIEKSNFNLYFSNKKSLFLIFNIYKKEIKKNLNIKLILPSYELLLKIIHIFNLLDSKNILSNIERIIYINNIKKISCKISKFYIKYKNEK